jgi:hypothetical protein
MPAAALVLVLALGNIMANPTMPPADVRHDIRALFGLRADVTCGNEIEPDRYKRTWRAESARYGLRPRAVAYPDPLAVRGRPVAVSARRLSRGVAGLTPDRWAVVARFPHLAVICTQLVSRAWTSNDATTPLRRRLWLAEVRTLRRMVARHLAAGRSVIVGGDLNTPHRIRWGRREVFLGNAYRMQAAVVPAAGWRARRLPGGRTIPPARLFTDHPILRRIVALDPLAHVG